LVLLIGLAIAGALFGLGSVRVTRAIPNGQEVISLPVAHPGLLYLSIPGIALMWFTVLIVQVKWASYEAGMQLLMVIGNAIFYSLAVYVLQRIAEGLSAKWRRR
jgi:hypothetical protein